MNFKIRVHELFIGTQLKKYVYQFYFLLGTFEY